MSQRHEWIFCEREYTAGKYTHENTFNILAVTETQLRPDRISLHAY